MLRRLRKRAREAVLARIPEGSSSLDAAHERIVEDGLKLGGRSCLCCLRANSHIGKALEIHQEDPGRIHVVLIRQGIGF